MEQFRIGNDISITWTVKKNGEDADLKDKTVALYMTHPKGREVVDKDNVTITDNVVSFVFEGLKQKVLGRYTLTIDVKEVKDGNEKRYLIQDKCGAFALVGRSCEERQDKEDYKIEL